MGIGDWALSKPAATSAAVMRLRVGRLLSHALVVLGVLFLLAATTYTAYALVNTWLMEQDRFL